MQATPNQIPNSSPGEGAFSYLHAVASHKRLVALIALVALLGAGLWLNLRSPSYEASSQILVSAVQGQEEGALLGLDLVRESVDPSRTIQTAASLVESREAAEQAAKKLGGGWSADSVLAAIQVRPEGESNILAVTATADGADEAARLANAFAESSMSVRDKAVEGQVDRAIETIEGQVERAPGGDRVELEATLATLEALRGQGDPTLSVAERATPPGSPSGPGAPLIIVLALLCGIAVGCAAAVVLELTERNVRDEEEVRSLWPLPILVRVPKVSRANRAPGLSASPEVREAFRGLAVQFDQAADSSRTILITSPSTGDGKTTAGVNLASQLAADGHSVILLDFDLRKPDVGRALGLPSANGLEPLSGGQPASLSSLLAAVPDVPNLKAFTTSPDSAAGADIPIGPVGDQLLHFLREASEMATFVVVDTPPVGEVSDALRWAHLADDVLVVTRLGNSDRAGLASVREVFEQLGVTARGLILVGATQHVRSAYLEQGRIAHESAKHPPTQSDRVP